MKIDILMVTFRRDLEFAEYSMKAVRKFCTGFAAKVVVVPTPDGDMYREIATPLGFQVKTFDEWPNKGMLHHEAIIIEADKWCDGDVILHLDADCLFTGPIDASDYFLEGKPIMYRQRYETFKNHPNRYGWKACVLEATGIDPEWETMCRHPCVYLRETYQQTQAAITQHTGMSYLDFIKSCRNAYPQTFAEFPTLGAVAISNHPEKYRFIEWADGNTDVLLDRSRDKVKAFWAQGGLEMKNDRHPDETAGQMIDRILAQ